MKFNFLLNVVGDEPVFSSALLMTHGENQADIRRQLSRWVNEGKLIQLRRSIYMLAEPYRKKAAHPFLLANRLKSASYVSLQSALAWYGLIPEYVPVVTSVTTGRPGQMNTPSGNFVFKHVKKRFFSGYVCADLPDGQTAFVASPEKALLDLIYLTPGADTADYLSSLRIQHPERLDRERLRQLASSSGSAKLIRAASRLDVVLSGEEYVDL
jgi:predicted transcriptional regulator of viral defense system